MPDLYTKKPIYKVIIKNKKFYGLESSTHQRFFFFQFCGDHPQGDLATSGYRTAYEIKIYKKKSCYFILNYENFI